MTNDHIYSAYTREMPSQVAATAEAFVGRAWILPRIVRWLTETNSRYLLVTGSPGSGKSSLVAWLSGANKGRSSESDVYLNKIRAVLRGVHYCQSDSGRNSPKAFAEAMTSQLLATVEGFEDALLTSLGKSIIIHGTASAGIAESGASIAGVTIDLGTMSQEAAFDYSFREPIKNLFHRGYSAQMLLIVDALDEAYSYTGASLPRLLAKLADLPDQVRLLITTRSDPRVLTYFHRSRTIDIVADEPNPGSDIRTYVTTHPTLRRSANGDHEIVEKILENAHGVFLYASIVLGALAVSLRPETVVLPTLPSGLASLYHDFLLRELVVDETAWYQRYLPLLGVLSVAQEPGLTQQKLDQILGRQTIFDLRVCHQFLEGNISSGPLRLFHQSFVDYLTEDINNEYRIRKVNAHRLIGSSYLRDYDGDWTSCDQYGLANLAIHLCGADMQGELGMLLTEFNWLSSKLSAFGMASVINDFSLLKVRDNFAANLIQWAIRLSGNILETDGSQLAPQLVGRLQAYADDPSISRLLGEATAKRSWLRPINQCLTPPGGAQLRIMKGHSNRINAIAVTPDGRQLVSGSSDQTLMTWDIETGIRLRVHEAHDEGVNDVAITPDGSIVLSASGDISAMSAEARLIAWNNVTGEMSTSVNEPHAFRIRAVRVTSDGRFCVLAVDEGYRESPIMQVRALPSLEIVSEFDVPHDFSTFSALAITSTDLVITVGEARDYSAKSLICSWRVPSGEAVYRKDLEATCEYIAPFPDGQYIAVAEYDDKSITVRSVADFSEHLRLTGHTKPVQCLTLTTNGRHIVSGASDSNVRIWDTITGDTVAVLTGHTAAVESVAVTPNNRFLVSGGRDNTLRVWDLERVIADGVAPTDSTKQYYASSLAITAQGKEAIAGCRDGRLWEWEVEADPEPRVRKGSGQAILASMIRDDGSVLCCSSRNISLWSSRSRREKLAFAGSDIANAGFSPSGRLVAVADKDASCSVWDLSNGQRIATYEGHQEHGHDARARAGWTENFIQGIAVTDDGLVVSLGLTYDRGLFWIDPSTAKIVIWSAADGSVVSKLVWNNTLSGAIAVNNDLLYIGRNNLISMYDFPDANSIGVLEGHLATVQRIAVSQNGVYLASYASDRTIRVWDTRKRFNVATFYPDEEVDCLAISDTSRLVAADAAGRVCFFDLVR